MTSNRSLTLRTQHYKYISPSDGGPMITWGPAIETGYRPTPQLFDLSRSDYEEKDVSAEKPKTLQRLQRLLGQVRSGK
ncbi:arylsulfatase A [Prevotella sp. CAG:891]|nr:arylsulfatase A [Prevotella sp. CAG:891]